MTADIMGIMTFPIRNEFALQRQFQGSSFPNGDVQACEWWLPMYVGWVRENTINIYTPVWKKIV